MSEPFKFPTAEEITRDWGDRCADFDQDCGCCQMWNTYDLIAAKDAELARLRTGIKRLSDEEELCTETTGDDPFSLVYLAAKLAAAEDVIRRNEVLFESKDETIRQLSEERSELRAKLFPYADATEISGISWDGKYLIGDKASIRFFHEMKNRGEQIDVYKRAYDQNLAAKDAEIAALKEELVKANRDMDMYRDHGDRKSEQVIALQQSDRRLRDALRKISEKAEDNLPMRTPGSMVHLAEVALNGGSDAP